MCPKPNSAVRTFGSLRLLSESSFLHLPRSSAHLPFVSFLPTFRLYFFLPTAPVWPAAYVWLLYSPHLIPYTHSTPLINLIPYHSLASINLLSSLLYHDTLALALDLVFTEQYSFMDLKLRLFDHGMLLSAVLLSLPIRTHSFPS